MFLVQRIASLLFLLPVVVAVAAEQTQESSRFLAVRPLAVAGHKTWTIHDRDGGNRQVKPYLSSLAQGETATGAIASPPFKVSGESITFTLCGHDGQGGGKEGNYVALVDDKTGETLRKMLVPGNDAMQERSWNVADLQGRSVHMELHDGLAQPAFAWMGVGRVAVDGGFQIDFQNGLPEGWHSLIGSADILTETVSEGIPFRRQTAAYSMVPAQGVAEFPCDFHARRLFFLGCTVSEAQTLDVCGWIEIVYDDGAADRFPLKVGYTLDCQAKLLSPSPALHLHPSGDPFQYYLVVRPRPGRISTIRLSRNVGALPRITAITCEPFDFQAESKNQNLLPLPEGKISDREEEWIATHDVRADSFGLLDIEAKIRQAHRIKAVTFNRIKISDEAFEAASIFDVDNNGTLDIVSGAFWYEGPDFAVKHKIRDIRTVDEYLDDFSDYPMDVNGDGYMDMVTGAYFGNPLQWVENPQGSGELWTVHDIEQVGSIETVRFWDVDGDGTVEVIPNAGGNIIFFRLVLDEQGKGTGEFTRHVVKMGGCGHGLGFGDINGDGRGDFVVPNGWLESPKDPLEGEWIWHDDQFRLGLASVPLLVHDVNQDGLADLIAGQGHGYGLDWLEQVIDAQGARSWVRHPIDRFGSQYHTMELADIDNDGVQELITGKRHRAHSGNDPGSADSLFVRYYEIAPQGFTAHTIDAGPAGKASGIGLFFDVKDIDQDGWKDIIAPGKEGLYLFKNQSSRDK